MQENWNVIKVNNSHILVHNHSKEEHPCICYKIDNRWFCIKCNEESSKETGLFADLCFCIPAATLYTKNREDFIKSYITLNNPKNTARENHWKPWYTKHGPVKMAELLDTYYHEYCWKEELQETYKQQRENIIKKFNLK